MKAGLIVFLNKQDVLERKIKEGRSIAKYFPEYKNFKADGNTSDEYTKAKEFVKNLLVVNFLLNIRIFCAKSKYNLVFFFSKSHKNSPLLLNWVHLNKI